MDIKLSTVVGGGGGTKTLTMPSAIQRQNRVVIKNSNASETDAQAAAFYTAIELDFTELGWDTATLSATADTTEQTIIDITDSGVLINVIGSLISAAGDFTTRVTIDGVTTTFVAAIDAGKVAIMGDFYYSRPSANTNDSTSVGGGLDEAWAVLQKTILMNPAQVIARGQHGMVFNTSLKVTIQGSVALNVGSTSNKSVVTYFTSIPEGL